MSQAAAHRSGLALAAIAAVLFSAKAIMAKLMYRYGIDAITLMALRMLMSVPVFAAIALVQAHRANRRGDRLAWRERGLILVLGVLGYYLASVLDFWGLQFIPAALERLILFLTPTVVLSVSAMLLRKPINARQWLAMWVSYAGIVLVFGENLRLGGADIVFGSALVFGATLSYALYLVLSGELVRHIGSLRLVAYAMCVSTVLTLIHFAAMHDVETLRQPMPVYLLSAVNAMFCTVAPVYLTMFALARIGASASSQMSVLGPVSLVFLGWWVLDEPITLLQLAGTAVVLGGVWLLLRAPRNASADSTG